MRGSREASSFFCIITASPEEHRQRQKILIFKNEILLNTAGAPVSPAGAPVTENLDF